MGSAVDDYIAGFPADVRDVLHQLRAAIRKTVPEAEEAIAYGVPTFRYHGNLVHFAAFKNHVSFFPGGEAREVFSGELAGFRGGKGTVQFPLDRPVPFDLIARITRHRAKENEAKASQRKAKRSDSKR